jgi:hypothetical protein
MDIAAENVATATTTLRLTVTTFLSLPDELLPLIVAFVLDDCPDEKGEKRELLSFILVCSRLHFASLALLYAKAEITTEQTLHSFLRIVHQRADLASYVKSLTVNWISCYYPFVKNYHWIDSAERQADEVARADAIFVNDSWRTRRIPQLTNCYLLDLHLARGGRRYIDAAMPFYELL